MCGINGTFEHLTQILCIDTSILNTVFIQELSEIGTTYQLMSLNQGTWKNLATYSYLLNQLQLILGN